MYTSFYAPVIVALDGFSKIEDAAKVIERIDQRHKRICFKVNDLFFHPGFRDLQRSFRVPWFLDLKLHDIPNTVQNAARRLRYEYAPNILTVHASGGHEMVRSAVMACTPVHDNTWQGPRIAAVTVLTSLDDAGCEQIFRTMPSEAVGRFAQIAAGAGAWAVVCSQQELALIPKSLKRIVPGIRPQWAPAPQDQKRVATPAEAMASGADYLVIGRPIVQHEAPEEALAMTLAEVGFDPVLDFAAHVGALKFDGPYTLKSGRQSPYFFNAGAFDDAAALSQLGGALADVALQTHSEANKAQQMPNVIAGPAYKGHALAMAMAEAFHRSGAGNMRVVFERKEAKTHGEVAGQWVGTPPRKGDRVLIVDDVITDGATKRAFIEQIRAAGATVVGVLVVLDRGERETEAPSSMSAAQALEEAAKVPVDALIHASRLPSWLEKRSMRPAADALVGYLRQWGPTL